MARPTAAFAVSDGPNGTIIVEVDRLEDAAELEAQLKARGVNAQIEYPDDGTLCQDNRFTPYEWTPAPGERPNQSFYSIGTHRIHITLDPREVPAGTTFVLTATRLPDPANTYGGIGAQVGTAAGPVAECVPHAVDHEPAGSPS